MENRARWKGTALALISFISICLATFYALASGTTDFPKMVVVGERQEDGEPLVCSSGYCFDSAQEEAALAFMEWKKVYSELPQDDPPLNGERFCQLLAAKQPQGCSLSEPPASPGIPVPGQAAWQPNGCGTSPTSNWLLSHIVELGYDSVFTGNLNAPYPGVSFEGACNAHDACWGSAYDRTWCDINFQNDMNDACEVISSTSGWGECRGLSSAYHAAVSTDQAGAHYQATVAERTCALWALDMRENECSR